LARQEHDKKARDEASSIKKRWQSEVHAPTVCRLSFGIRRMVKVCS
jgi:hypothetical protein